MKYRAVKNKKTVNEIVEVSPKDLFESCDFINCTLVGCGSALFRDCVFSNCVNCFPGDLPRVSFEGCSASRNG